MATQIDQVAAGNDLAFKKWEVDATKKFSFSLAFLLAVSLSLTHMGGLHTMMQENVAKKVSRPYPMYFYGTIGGSSNPARWTTSL